MYGHGMWAELGSQRARPYMGRRCTDLKAVLAACGNNTAPAELGTQARPTWAARLRVGRSLQSAMCAVLCSLPALGDWNTTSMSPRHTRFCDGALQVWHSSLLLCGRKRKRQSVFSRMLGDVCKVQSPLLAHSIIITGLLQPRSAGTQGAAHVQAAKSVWCIALHIHYPASGHAEVLVTSRRGSSCVVHGDGCF